MRVVISQPTTTKIILWNTLAFQAGSLNIGGFLACFKFVSHVTGFSTLFAAELAMGRFRQALGFLTVPLFFLLGSFISGFLIDAKVQRGESPRFDLVFLLLSFLTATILALGASHVFGKFGMSVNMDKDYYLLALLCLSCGLQNATVTSAYGAIVRTSHLTGLTTDLGIGLSRLFSLKEKTEQKKLEIKANLMRAGIIFSFTLGSVVSGYLFVKFAYWGFVIPFLISVGLYVLTLAFKNKKV